MLLLRLQFIFAQDSDTVHTSTSISTSTLSATINRNYDTTTDTVSYTTGYTTTVLSSLTDCQKVVNLAIGLNMNIKQPNIMSSLKNDCCTAPGVICSGTTVTEISWGNLLLNGTIIGSMLPSSLETFSLENTDSFVASVNGYMPSSIPATLKSFNVGNNRILGTLPEYPPNILELIVYSNKLSGDFPNRKLPDSMMYLNAWGNFFTGSLPSQLPVNLIVLYISGNKMVGTLPQLPTTLRYLDLGASRGNKFSGEVHMKNPIRVYLNFNWITNVVFDHTSSLTDCDISSNPLLEHANDPNLASCTKVNIYSASSMPKTNSQLSSSSISKSAVKYSSTSSERSLIVANATANSTDIRSAEVGSTDGYSSEIHSTLTGTLLMKQNLTSKKGSVQTSATIKKVAIKSTRTSRTEAESSQYYETEMTYVTYFPNASLFAFSSKGWLFILIKYTINFALIGYVVQRAPFLRELRTARSRTITPTGTITYSNVRSKGSSNKSASK